MSPLGLIGALRTPDLPNPKLKPTTMQHQIQSFEDYQVKYKQSVEDPEGFLGEIGRSPSGASHLSRCVPGSLRRRR